MTEYFTKHSLTSAAGLDPRSKAIKALQPVAYLHYTVGSKIPLYSVEQLKEITIREVIQMNDPHKHEPEAPTVSFVTYAGDRSGRTADYVPWLQDLKERQARGAEQEAKRRQLTEQASKPIDVVAELDSALTALEAGSVDFDNSYGKINQPLVDAKTEAERLRGELAEAEARLAEFEAKGDSVQRLSTAVAFAEARLQGLLATVETEAINALARKHYGWDIPLSRVSREMRQEFRNHASVIALQKFYIVRHPGKSEDVEALKARLEAVGCKLADLRQHILGEQSQHDASATA